VGSRLPRKRVVFLVFLGTAGFVTTLYLRGAPELAEREQGLEPIVPTPAVGHYYDAAQHVDWAKRELRQASRYLQAARPAPKEALDDALASLRRLEGVHAERARPHIRRITELRNRSGDVRTEEIEQLIQTMDDQIVGELAATPPDTAHVLAEAEGTPDHHRCRLGMGYLSTYILLRSHLLRSHPHLGAAYRRTGVALLRTVDGNNRGVAKLALHAMEEPGSDDYQAVGYAAYRCQE